MELFDDLMGITHHTGDAWLDKKLNENTAYIGFLTSMALGAAGSKLFGGDRAPKSYGGGFDPALRPYMTQGLSDLQTAYQNPAYFEGPLVAAFDPAQLQAQTSLLALSSADPDYFRTATEGLGEAIDLQRQAAVGITPEAIAAQREILAPTAEIERRAARRGLEEALTGIGVGAAGAGVGALEGGRADVLRGVAGGEFATTLSGIEGGLTERAIAGAEAQRAREAAAASGLSSLFSEQLGIAKGETASDIARAQLAAGVGAERRDLAQARIGEQREMFEEQDPFARAQRYLATVQSAPVQKTQYYQPKSTLQEAAGLASLFAPTGGFTGAFKQGGDIAQAAGMSQAAFDALDADIEEADRINAEEDEARGRRMQSTLADLAKGTELREQQDREFDAKQVDAQRRLQQLIAGGDPSVAFRQPGGVVAGGNLSTASGLASMTRPDKDDVEETKRAIRKARAEGRLSNDEYDRQMSFLTQQKPKQDERIKPLEEKDPSSFFSTIGRAIEPQVKALADAGQHPTRRKKTVSQPTAQPNAMAMSTPATTTVAPAPPQVGSAIPANVRALDEKLRTRFGPQTKDMDSPPSTKVGGPPPSLMDRILGSVQSGLRSISSTNLDPFKDFTARERVRIGLGILGAVPEIGEGPLGPIGRGALLAIEDLPEAEEITPRATPMTVAEFDNIDKGILKLQKVSTKFGADRRNELRTAAETQAIGEQRAGLIPNDNVSYRTRVKNIYTNLINEAIDSGAGASAAKQVSAAQAVKANS